MTDWESVGHARVFIRCFRADGALADTPFATNFVLHGDASPGIAYVYGSCSTLGCTIGLAFDPTPDPVTVERNGTGSYVVGLPGMAGGVGNVQVSAQSGSLFACRATGLSSSGGARVVDVECRDGTGALSDSGFLLVYTKQMGLTGVRRSQGCSSTGDEAGSDLLPPCGGSLVLVGWQHPDGHPQRAWHLPGGAPRMPGGGSAQVTPFGAGKARCTLTGVSSTGTPQRIGVRCYDPNGTAADSKFSLAYTH